MNIDNFMPVSPYYHGKSEAFLRLFVDITGMIDDKGRRLHEAAFRSEQEEDAFKVCKFSGSRHGKLMNQNAFRDIFSSWHDILATQQLFRELFLSKNKPNYPNLGEVWQMSLLPLFAPFYWKLSTHEPNPPVLPSIIAGLHKIALGVPSVIELMILLYESRGIITPDEPITEPHVFAEKYGLLVNESWACAGPPNMMKTFDDALSGNSSIASSNQKLPFEMKFTKVIYANFSFIMTCQYVCGRFFWLYDILIMEYAFSQLAANDLYYVDTQSSQNKALTPPKKRRQVILPIILKDNSILKALSSYYIEILKESEQLVGVLNQTKIVFNYLDSMNEAFSKVDKKSPIALLDLHDQNKNKLTEIVKYFRTQLFINMNIQDQTDIASLSIDFESPADDLRHILNKMKK